MKIDKRWDNEEKYMKIIDSKSKKTEVKKEDEEKSKSKQNASYQDFATPSKLDSEVEDILNSIKNDVMTSIKKTKYFTKNSNETSD